MGKHEAWRIGAWRFGRRNHFTAKDISFFPFRQNCTRYCSHKFILLNVVVLICCLVTVGCGDNHTILVLDDGKIYSFGLNDFGQLGHSRPRTRAGMLLNYVSSNTAPFVNILLIISEQVDGLEAHNITQVACGAQHTLAQNEWGEVFAWGSNSNGQLGLNLDESMILAPKMVKSLATKQVVQIACGRSHSMALTNGNYNLFLIYCDQ